MERYKNLSGISGVKAYEIGGDFIRVEFSEAVYVYDYSAPGQNDVTNMKELAEGGIGLNTFINKNVRKKYARKEH